jgi:geranylgeranyl diphosphate synthase type II
MNPKELIASLQIEIENRIQEVTALRSPLSIYEPFNYVMSGGGKRIRPLFAALSCGVISDNHSTAIDSAVAVEILHNYTLVHDDIMDNSPMRRNRMTVHKKWDDSTAILTGDIMQGYAYRIIPDYSQSERADKVREILAQVNIDVCLGQALDMEYNSRKDIQIEDYIKMIDFKTAKLLVAAVMIGGNIGLANDEELGLLEEFAHNLGIGFQIQDDVLDLTANEEKLGKTLGLDIAEGKKTLLILKSIELAEKQEHKEMLDNFMKNNGDDITNVPKYAEMMTELGVFTYALNLADEYFAKSRTALMKLKDNVYRDSLSELLNNLIKRDK